MSYLPVSSNDTLSHLALPNSPETLCGKAAVDTPTPSNYLICDVCSTLSNGDAILKQTALLIEAGQECPHCESGFDITGHVCWNCEGAGRLYAESNILSPEPVQCPNCGATIDSKFAIVNHIKSCPGAQLPAPPKQRAAQTYPTCTNCGYKKDIAGEPCPSCGNSKEGPYDQNAKATQEIERLRTATNWTRDGVAIENGFDITITTDQAARTPFLDYTRVAVSEQRECPDCNETHWLSKIASCTDCDGLKCTSCMETIGFGGFLGTCKKCAGTESDLAYESAYEDSVHSDQDRFLAYALEDDDQGIDPFFLPSDPE